MSLLHIERLGHHGNGIAEDGSHHPLTLPGDSVDPDSGQHTIGSSEIRATPVCPAFRSLWRMQPATCRRGLVISVETRRCEAGTGCAVAGRSIARHPCLASRQSQAGGVLGAADEEGGADRISWTAQRCGGAGNHLPRRLARHAAPAARAGGSGADRRLAQERGEAVGHGIGSRLGRRCSRRQAYGNARFFNARHSRGVPRPGAAELGG